MYESLALSITPAAQAQIEEMRSSPTWIPAVVFAEDVELPVVSIGFFDPELANDYQEEHEARGASFLYECEGRLLAVLPGEWAEQLDGKVLECFGDEFRILGLRAEA